MTQKTIMLADLPASLGDTLEQALSRQGDVAIVRGPAQGDPIAAALNAKAGAIVMSRRDPAALDAIDSTLANLSIVALTPDGRTAYVHRIRADTHRLDDPAPQEIAALLLRQADAKSQ